MPAGNGFRHQAYPTVPQQPPEFHMLKYREGVDGEAEKLHTELDVSRVILVHGTFLGDDPFGVSDTLRVLSGQVPLLAAPFREFADSLQTRARPVISAVSRDIGNYNAVFCDQFQRLVGDDPVVELLEPTWSGQNHAFARVDLAIRLLHQLFSNPLQEGQRTMLWGHSHAGNAFAILTNLLAEGKSAMQRIQDIVGIHDQEHWVSVVDELSQYSGPHPLAESLLLVTFGTPVRYGWDPLGYRDLLHISFHRVHDPQHPDRACPLFPPQPPGDVISARWGDWVQAFALAGTDISLPQLREINQRLDFLLEAGLEDPQHGLDTQLLVPKRFRDLCARLKLGVRCHTDGLNLLVDYERSGETIFPGIPIEKTAMGHGVATTEAWLATHLRLVIETLLGRLA